MPQQGFSRTITRSLLNLFRQAEINSQPGPAISDGIQLVQIVEDLSHLVIPVVAPSGITTFSEAATAVVFSRLRLTAPSARAVAIVEIVYTAVAPGLLATNVGDVISSSAAPALEVTWGPANLNIREVGTTVAAGAGLALIQNQVVDALPIILAPGDTLDISSIAANTATSAVITWFEIG